jgi:hypothetical protein
MLKGKMFVFFGILLLAIALCGCDQMDDKYGSSVVGVKPAGLATTDIDQITVTVTGPNIVGEIVAIMAGNPETGWSGLIEDIPAGDDRVFHAQAYDASDVLIYEGTASGVTIIDGETIQVIIFLQQSVPPDPFENSVPRFDSIVISESQVAPDHEVDITAAASDPDDDPLTYSWSATGGVFSDTTSPDTVWTAPTTEGWYTLTVEATDPYDASATVSFDLDVRVYYGEGNAEVLIDVNTWPVVSGLVPDPTRIDVGETTNLNLTASDPDGDTLFYSWAATCVGTFSDTAIEDPSFTLTVDNNDEDCVLTATITDGRGGSNTASIGIQTGAEVEVCEGVGGTWVNTTGAMNEVRRYAAYTLLSDGTVLAAGGYSDMASAEVFNPATEIWTPTGSMTTGRSFGRAIKLDDGRVLVAGGNGDAAFSAEIYSPTTGIWSSVASMNDGRYLSAMSLLPDGRVLVAGGSATIPSAEIYNPDDDTWSLTTNPMESVRVGHSSVPLSNGKVLVAKGDLADGPPKTNTAELFNPATGLWEEVSDANFATGYHTATALPDGRVLFCGGVMYDPISLENETTSACETYDPVSNTWDDNVAPMNTARLYHSAVLLNSNYVLVVGGENVTGWINDSEIYNIADDCWTETGALNTGNIEYFGLIRLADGSALAAGGTDASTSLSEILTLN